MNTTLSTCTYSLDHLSNDDLLAGTRSQVGRSNRVLAALLAHLAEVDARGLYRLRASSSLYTYCVYELRMSEDQALRRAHAAKIARRFPVVFEQIAAGEIHLTGVLMLGPHLTEANHVEVLARARHRTKMEIAKLVRQLDPLPEVPPRIEPLGPDPKEQIGSATHSRFVAALAGPVRELPPGDRPKDWCDGSDDHACGDEVALPPQDEEQPESSLERGMELGPQRYKVRFTASQEYVDLIEQASDLLGAAVPKGDLEEVHLRAMRLLVAELKKRKYAMVNKPRSAKPRAEPSAAEPAPARVGAKQDAPAEVRVSSPRQRGRHVPAAAEALEIDARTEAFARAAKHSFSVFSAAAARKPKLLPTSEPVAIAGPGATMPYGSRSRRHLQRRSA